MSYPDQAREYANKAEFTQGRIDEIAAAYIRKKTQDNPRLPQVEANSLGGLEADRDGRVKDLAAARDRYIQLSIMYSNLAIMARNG